MFQHLNVLTEKLYMMTSLRLSMRIHETVKNMSSLLHRVQRADSKVHGGAVLSSYL